MRRDSEKGSEPNATWHINSLHKQYFLCHFLLCVINPTRILLETMKMSMGQIIMLDHFLANVWVGHDAW